MAIETIVPSYTKVPDINESSTFEDDTNTFLNEINSRTNAGNQQALEINDTVSDINTTLVEMQEIETTVKSQAVDGGYSQAVIDEDFKDTRHTAKSAQLSGEFKLKTEVEKNGASTVLYTGQISGEKISSIELITNGTFDTDISGWTSNGLSSLSEVNNSIRITNIGSVFGSAYQAITTEVGKTYTATASLSNGTSSFVDLRAGTTIDGLDNGYIRSTSSQIVFLNFTASSTTTYISILSNDTSNTYIEADNISVKESVTALPEETGEYYWDNTNLHINNGIDYVTASDRVMALAQWNNTETCNSGDERRFQREGRWFRVVYLQDGITGVANNPALMFDFTDDTLFEKMQIDSETKGGRAWIKSRTSSSHSHYVMDSIREAGKEIHSDINSAETYSAIYLTSFNNNGFSIGVGSGVNSPLHSYVSWGLGTTHVKSGVTTQGKPYIEESNPKTLFTMIKYRGSGLSGHGIPHSLDRELGLVKIKNLNDTDQWIVHKNGMADKEFLNLDDDGGISTTGADYIALYEKDSVSVANHSGTNGAGELLIMYGYGQAYKDDNNELNGIFDFGIYGGGDDSLELDNRISAIDIKRTNSTGDWFRFDILRIDDDSESKYLTLNTSSAESTDESIPNIQIAGSKIIFGNNFSGINEANSQYFYKAIIDNDNESGQSTYLEENDTGIIEATNLTLSYSDGATDNTIKEFGDIEISNVQWELD